MTLLELTSFANIFTPFLIFRTYTNNHVRLQSNNSITLNNAKVTEQNKILIYTGEEGKIILETRLENETVWLTQEQMSLLFQRERSVITKHLKNIFAEGELEKKSNVQNLHIGGSDKPVNFYNLD